MFVHVQTLTKGDVFVSRNNTFQHNRYKSHSKRETLNFVRSSTQSDVMVLFYVAQGLAPLVFPEQPGLCLVSNGAECVLIQKKLYEQHCPHELRRRLKTEVSLVIGTGQ